MTDISYLGFCRVFDTVPHDILVPIFWRERKDPEGPGQAGQVGLGKPHEATQIKVQVPAPGSWQSQTLTGWVEK